MGLKWDTTWGPILLVLSASATWLITLAVRAGSLNPVLLNDLMADDIQGLGPIAFILIFIVLGLFILWQRKKKANKQEPKWESAFLLE